MVDELSLSGDDWRVLYLLHKEWHNRNFATAEQDLDNLARPAFPWVPARVPGSVQSDLVDAGLLPDPWYDRNSYACEWTSARDWVYAKTISLDLVPAGRTRLVFDGVDHACHVILNGRHLGDHEGMFVPFSFDVTDVLRPGDNQLLVAIDRAPTEPDVQGSVGFTQDVRTWKARFAYGWDWCPRLIPLGIWDDVRLVTDAGARLDDVWVRPAVTIVDGTATASIAVTAEISATGTSDAIDLEVIVRDPDGAEVGSAASDPGAGLTRTVSVPVPDPRLWHPNGSGEQPLYAVDLRITRSGELLDARSVRTGLRTVRLLANDRAPDDALPYVLEVNGRREFIKGWNWVPVDQLYGRTHDERYRHLVGLARDSHCNLLRVWGGGLLERTLFYDLCDEAGILVWQEFLQSSSGVGNAPAEDDAYVRMATETATAMVRQRRNHTSLVIWCGGNELLDDTWVPLDERHPALAALRDVVAEHDPDRIYLPASPSGPTFMPHVDRVGALHDVHGGWSYWGDGDHYAFYDGIDPMLHSEFGSDGAANVETLRRTVPDEHLWPPDQTNPAWVHRGSWWLHRPMVERLFGPVEDIESYVKASQWLQVEGLRYAVEAGRRRAWRTSGTIPWQFNESFPNASCTNVVDYFGHPKPAYWAVRTAYAPVALSLQYERLQWAPGTEATATAWCALDDSLAGPASLEWAWSDALTGDVVDAGSLVVHATAPVTRVGDVPLRFPASPGVFVQSLTLRERATGRVVARNDYLFSSYADAPFAALLGAQTGTLEVVARGATLLVSSESPLVGVSVTADGEYAGAGHAEGYLPYLSPGETWAVAITPPGELVVRALTGAKPVTVPVDAHIGQG